MKQYNITLGVVEGLKVKPFEVVSQDLNGNQLNIQLVQDSSMLPYDLTGATSVILYFLREDGVRYQEYATITNHTQGRIEIVLETDVFAVKGKTLAEVAVYDGEEKKCTSQVFGFFVRKNLNDGEVFVSSNQLPDYRAEMARLETILENLIITAGDSNPEIVAARYSIADGIDFPTLGDRLDHIDSKIEGIEIDLTPIENEIADLAGPGRTTETVKQNADDIAQVADDLAAHQAESVTDTGGVHGIEYEEGIFDNFELRFGGNNTDITYASRFGRYTKINKRVNVELEFELTSKGTATGAATITGLPIASSSNRPINAFSVGNFREFALISGTIQVGGQVLSNSTSISLLFMRDGIADTAAQDTHFKNNTRIRIQFSYLSN